MQLLSFSLQPFAHIGNETCAFELVFVWLPAGLSIPDYSLKLFVGEVYCYLRRLCSESIVVTPPWVLPLTPSYIGIGVSCFLPPLVDISAAAHEVDEEDEGAR